jgi:sugar lactone lactonase YvrE
VASDVAPRALAISPNAAAVDFTNASAPNQVFTVGLEYAQGVPALRTRFAAIAGTGAPGSLGDGGAATAAQLAMSESSLLERSGIAIAGDGTLYVSDTGNATIRAIAAPSSSEPGVIRSVAGRWAARKNVTLVEPMGIALDRAGNLYIADHGAGAVDVMVAGTGQLQTLAQVACPADLAVSSNGSTVYVTSPEKGVVFSINARTHAIQTVSGLGAAKTSSGSGCAAPPLAGSQGVPTGITFAGIAADAAGNLFVADVINGRILKFDAQISVTSTVASGLSQPGALAFDSNGNLYAAEQGLSRIVAFAQMGASQGSISLSPASGALGNEPTGGASAAQTFTITNVSTSTAVTGLTVPKTTTPADFTVLTNNCTTTLAANSSCALGVAFTPTATGLRSATLTVTDANPSDSASTVLGGTGDDYEVELANGQLMSVSVQAGDAITMNLQIVPDNVFSGVVTLVCPSNLPKNTTCTFSSTTVNVTPGTPAPFQVTFQTTGVVNPINTQAPRGPFNLPQVPRFPALASVAVLGWLLVSFFEIVSTGSPRRDLPAFVLIVLPLLAVAILAGCKKQATAESIGATPSGSTNMVITGTSQNASRALSITLNVVTL